MNANTTRQLWRPKRNSKTTGHLGLGLDLEAMAIDDHLVRGSFSQINDTADLHNAVVPTAAASEAVCRQMGGQCGLRLPQSIPLPDAALISGLRTTDPSRKNSENEADPYGNSCEEDPEAQHVQVGVQAITRAA